MRQKRKEKYRFATGCSIFLINTMEIGNTLSVRGSNRDGLDDNRVIYD